MTETSRQYYKANTDARNGWRDRQIPRCMRCGAKNSLEIHEIERRSQAPRSWAHDCNYLLVCSDCHNGPFASMSHDKQLAYKLVANPHDFCLESWLQLRDPEGRAPERVTMPDIYSHLMVKK